MEMPISILLLLCLIFFVIGIVAMLLLQYYVYWKFSILPDATAEQTDINVKYSLPMVMQQTARSINTTNPAAASAALATSSSAALATSLGSSSCASSSDTESLMSLNFVMQFLFHELKNSNRVRKWFYRKLSLELDELIAKTTTGRLFDKLTIRELELGDQFPEIKMLRVHNVELDDNEGRIENLDLLMSLHYKGNFRTTIDADMVLGKKGSLTLKVRQLSGLARLQFTRKPYTHWSLSFLGDPELDLAIESKYQGRQMQSNITSLISNQIRKAVRRKHTLPNYKLRYKPFFHKTPEEESGDVDIQPNGLLTVKVAELTRLMCPAHLTDVYCTLTMASLAFVEARQKDDRNVIVSLDVEIHKAKNQQIGIIFKQATESLVEIETVLPNTPAIKSNLRAGDVLVAIEGKRVGTIQQIAKIVKGLQCSVFILRIERLIPGIIRNDAILEDLELYEDFGDLRSGYGSSKSNDLDVGPRPRQSSAEKGTSSESSLSSTPTNSPKKSKLIAKALKKTISRENSDSDRNKLKVDDKPKGPAKLSPDSINEVEHYYQHSTIDCMLSRFIQMEDLSNFKLDNHSRYLNVCVYGKCPGDAVLLGFVNVPINQILTECCETSLSQCLKTFELNPPIPQDLKTHPLSNQSGFNSNLCFGDILFSFTWDGNPNLAVAETPAKQTPAKSKIKPPLQSDRSDDSGISDSISIKSTATETTINTNTSNQPRAHNFIRTHFQRATQCDYCGKKIWLKDAVQCRECSMCCHKKCIAKCQNFTVCGPVDCSNAMTSTQTVITTTTTANATTIPTAATGSANNGSTPEFTLTQAKNLELSEAEEAFSANDDETAATPTIKANLEVHRASLTGLLAQGIKRVNSANNLAIPGIVSSLTGATAAAASLANTKSLPPSPQHSPSRKPSLVITPANPFETVTQRLEGISSELNALSAEQINLITEPIISSFNDEDVMSLAKDSSKNLYVEAAATERVNKINLLLSKLRLALDSETAMHSALTAIPKNETNDNNPQIKMADRGKLIGKSEDRVQALSVIMLYLCTGLQHAQGVAQQ